MLPGYKPSFSSSVGCWEPFGLYNYPYKLDLRPPSTSLGCMVPATMSRRNQQGELTYPHFALIYIDRDGNLRHEASRSIANSRETILSPRVTNEFLRAVARSSDLGPSHSQCHAPHVADIPGIEGHLQVPMPPGLPIQPALWPGQQEPWPTQVQQPRRKPWNEELSLSNQKATISISDTDFLRGYYEKVFQNLQQTNCRIIAKAYVKLVEPRKQVNYPYNGRKIVAGRTQQLEPDATKPPWWPAGVSHREPDHLPKAERIRLLVHILCDLRASNGVTARRLEQAEQPIRRQISPAERLQLLDELYEVREAEEKFLDGVADEKTTVSVLRANLPDAVELSVHQGEASRRATPAEEDASRQSTKETPSRRNGLLRSNIPQPLLVPSPDLPTNLTPSPHAATPSPSQYIQQDLPIHPGFEHTSSASPQDLKRKRPVSEAGPSTSTSPASVPYYSPVFVGSQPFLSERYDNLEGLPQPGGPNTVQPGAENFAENIEIYGFPYYFDN
ncbi:uncharacterized protein N7498_009186 [Penicillium cinerascens]|uniref:Subtelomeric hrmA-associated cluster protein AFUB-079030/YDR124W-like helical bundle domain-containing protein n=1 Tax=Penicillium cinerascens TaxID=70096 RepID=A0A9W9J9J6_9EURO|nr:uncharacterized protein N7498_009186 [Penicillium cinerascens]KAJ5190201.1 hypothetical protein N7498_009186 [Penicillium cinerascens]